MNKIVLLVFSIAFLLVVYTILGDKSSPDAVYTKELKNVVEKPKNLIEIPSKKTFPKQSPKNNRKSAHPSASLLPSKKLATKEQIETEESKPERPDEIVYSTSKEGIDGAMKIFLPNMRKCYDQTRAKYPDIEGRVTLSFQISKNDDPENMDIAKIEEVEILETDLDYEEMDNCIMDTIDNLWFAPPEDGTIFVRYPFVFTH